MQLEKMLHQQQHEIYFCLEKPIGIYNLNGIHK